MKHIQIRYLQQGLVDIEAPPEWGSMDILEKEYFCEEAIANTSDKDLVFGLGETKPNDINDFFVQKPIIEAIETMDNGKLETNACSNTWLSFIDNDRGLVWTSSQ